MRASGEVQFNDKTYQFNPNTDFGTLDWGRGVWTYENTWSGELAASTWTDIALALT